jgi:hypothetical protein
MLCIVAQNPRKPAEACGSTNAYRLIECIVLSYKTLLHVLGGDGGGGEGVCVKKSLLGQLAAVNNM